MLRDRAELITLTYSGYTLSYNIAAKIEYYSYIFVYIVSMTLPTNDPDWLACEGHLHNK